MALTCNKYFFLSKRKYIIAEAASSKIKGRYLRHFQHVLVGTDPDRGAIICKEMNDKQIIKNIYDGSTDEYDDARDTILQCSRSKKERLSKLWGLLQMRTTTTQLGELHHVALFSEKCKQSKLTNFWN